MDRYRFVVAGAPGAGVDRGEGRVRIIATEVASGELLPPTFARNQWLECPDEDDLSFGAAVLAVDVLEGTGDGDLAVAYGQELLVGAPGRSNSRTPGAVFGLPV
ncbi:MAG: hypothetical protein JXX28_03645 [Deltaproteobacteria bacterium]|nr:hypothetical protein [Deltaproteobacteria bacterium]